MHTTPGLQPDAASESIDQIASGLVASAADAPWLAALRDAYVDGIVMVDASGEFVYFNQAASDILGMGATPTSSAEWTTQYGLYEPDGTTPVAEGDLPLVRALRGETVRERVLFVRNEKQPAGVWIHVVAMPLGEEGHPIVGAVAVMRQMTDWYARMNKLVAMEARFLAFLHSSQDAVLLADPTGRVENWNDGAERLFGLTAEELGQRSIEDLLEVPTLDEQTEHQLTTIRMQGIHTDGSRFPADVSLAPSRTPQGLVYTFMIRDVTGEELLKAQLLQAQKMEAIGTLAAGVAHEINTPTQYVNDNVHFLRSAMGDLQPILEQVGVLVESINSGESPDPARLKELASRWTAADPEFLLTEIPMAIDQSQQGLSRIAEIVRSMKALSHPGQERDFVAEDLNDVIQQAVTVSTGEWKYVANVETSFDEQLPRIDCHRGELSQVMLNLIVNAAHAIGQALEATAGAKGTIRIATARKNDYAIVRISDTGSGIPAELRSRIFDPFFTTKAVGKGTGQGLAIALSIVVEKHRGKLSCESEVGVGTTFTIELPLKQEARHDSASPTSAPCR